MSIHSTDPLSTDPSAVVSNGESQPSGSRKSPKREHSKKAKDGQPHARPLAGDVELTDGALTDDALTDGSLTDGSSTNGSSTDTFSIDKFSMDKWKQLRKKLEARSEKQSAKSVFGKPSIGGIVYRWGVATALEQNIDSVRYTLSQLACDQKPLRRSSTRPLDLVQAANEMIAQLNHGDVSPMSCYDAVVWAGAIGSLSTKLPPQLWWELLGALHRFRELVLQSESPGSPASLMVGAELGLTLAWRAADLPTCKRASKSAIDALGNWFEHEQDAVPLMIAGAKNSRLIFASLIRCKHILEKTTKQKFKKNWLLTCDELATWIAAMVTQTGVSAFSTLSRKDVKDDLGDHGVLAAAISFDPETLKPATEAALGLGHSGGRLAWEVSLPDSFHHDEDAKLAILLPEWDVRKGRTHLDYSSHRNQIEVYAGRSKVISGAIETTVNVDGVEQLPESDWVLVCEYTDDDVHFVEIEQTWTGGIVLQRHVLVIREDRCVYFADGVMPKNPLESSSLDRAIRYSSRIPLAEGISGESEKETREVFLCDAKKRAIVLPMSAPEWRIGPSRTTLSTSEGDYMVLTSESRGTLYTPLWFDFQTRRFKRKRTWRSLTVADDRRLCESREAVGYRVQMGSEQWMVYRSLVGRRQRTVLGKHLIADFFAARFDPSDGNYDELVTVDDSEFMND